MHRSLVRRLTALRDASQVIYELIFGHAYAAVLDRQGVGHFVCPDSHLWSIYYDKWWWVGVECMVVVEEEQEEQGTRQEMRRGNGRFAEKESCFDERPIGLSCTKFGCSLQTAARFRCSLKGSGSS